LTRYLLRRDHSEKELRQKMSRRHTDDAINGAIAKANEYGYLKTPEELARRLAKALAQKGRGQSRIRYVLKKRGLPTIKFNPEDEMLRAQQVVDKLGLFRDDLNLQDKQKLMRKLYQRGFTPETIRHLLEKMQNEKR